MGIYKKNLPILNPPVTISKIGPPFPERLYLRSHKGNPRLIGIFNRIIMPRLFVLAD